MIYPNLKNTSLYVNTIGIGAEHLGRCSQFPSRFVQVIRCPLAGQKYMKKYCATFLAFLIFLFSLLLLTCCQDESPTGSKSFNVYSYIGYDSTGIKINTGWIKFELSDSVRLKGEWQLKSKSNVSHVGNQNGAGNLVGEIHADKILINLNPSDIDNNVILIGTLQTRVITGVWQWITYSGLTNWGTFKAEQ